jgi:hypothetical protein
MSRRWCAREAADDRRRGLRSALDVGLPDLAAMACTAARSSGEAAGKPASMTSTPRRASARATSSFSADVSWTRLALLAVAEAGVEDADVVGSGSFHG